MKKFKTWKDNISIRYTIIILFIILMLITVGFIGYAIFTNWVASTDESVAKFAEEMNTEIFTQIDDYFDIPLYINEVNYGMIENNVVNMEDEAERNKFFVGVMKTQAGEAVYSFSYGTEDGKYYGARRNENNQIEIMKNDEETGGHSWYYAVTEDMTMGKLVLKAGEFDPRTRDWYIAAKQEQKPVFSKIYKHFVMDDMVISAATPIYNKKHELMGVLGTHITLSKIDESLKNMVKEKNAFTWIVEKSSGELVSNSVGSPNFKVLDDGTMVRTKIEEINNPLIIKTYKEYLENSTDEFKYTHENETFRINIKEYQKEGLDWIVITGVPESLFMKDIYFNLKLALLIMSIAVIVSMVVYFVLTNKLLKPIDWLIDVTKQFSKGDWSQRAIIIKNNEIGRLSEAFNGMADTINKLVNNLETEVKVRTLELEKTNQLLMENKDRLGLILDSTAEAIFGIDKLGNCTFCNASGLKILGYERQEELIGKNMHQQIHYRYKNGDVMPVEKCKIQQALSEGRGTYADDEVFWKLDGTSINVEYYSYPQNKEDEIIGAVVTFMDNTDRKNKEEHIRYLSYHDSLTGLHNRIYFEEALINLDKPDNLPLAVIYGDVNGLKLTNDIFGHVAGDALLKKSAQILQKCCGTSAITTRVGGDEFAVLIPNTEENSAQNIVEQIRNLLSKEQIVAIKCSMSLGYHVKTTERQDIYGVVKKAEDKMYHEKSLHRKNINADLITTIMDTLHRKSPGEKQHSIHVQELCKKIGMAMKLSETELKRLEKAAYLHDIGKIILEEATLNKVGGLTSEENREVQQHAVVGYRILNLFEDTVDLSEIVLAHHECWDGTGYPKGLVGEEIPILARIISVAEVYDIMEVNGIRNDANLKMIVEEIKDQAGTKYDPAVVKILIELLE